MIKKEDIESYHKNGVVIYFTMHADGEIWEQALVVENYKELDAKTIIDEIDNKGAYIVKTLARVFARRPGGMQ